LIPVDDNEECVVKDAHRIINAQTPTCDLRSPNFDILQAIRTKLNELPIRTDTCHRTRQQGTPRLNQTVSQTRPSSKNQCADRQADKIYRKQLYRKQPRRTGLFPSWIPGTRPALPYFRANDKLPKASLRTFGMQLIRRIRSCEN
jgi:hypothetical protein